MSRHPAYLTCLFLAAAARTASPSELWRDVTGDFVPHLTDWQAEAGTWTTAGEEPPAGWYLRGKRQYDLHSLELAIRKDRAAGLVYVYTADWRVLLRPDKVIAKYAGMWGRGKPPYRHWIHYHYSAIRPISFTRGAWHTFRLTFDGESVTIHQNGKEVMKWRSPHEEWHERVKTSGKLRQFEQYEYPKTLPRDPLCGRDQIVVLHVLGSKASVRNVRVVGADRGEAQGFNLGVAKTPNVLPDWEVERLAPRSPVDVTWELDAEERKKASGLPSVDEWEVPKEHRVDPKSGTPKATDYFLGGAEPGTLPTHLYPYHKLVKTQKAQLYFNLGTGGEYTLQLSWGHWGMGWGPGVLEISVDGKPVSREVYRSFAQNQSCPPGMDYVPLRLRPGPHRIDFGLDLSHFVRFHYLQKYQRVMLGNVKLVPGVHEPLWTYTAGKAGSYTQREPALSAAMSMGETYGKLLKYRIKGLSPQQDYRVTLGFHEIDVNRPRTRLMDVYINEKQVEDDLDVFSEAGWHRDLLRTYRTQTIERGADGHCIEVKLVGKTFKAFLNLLKIEDANGKIVYHDNCGWHPLMANRIKRRQEGLRRPRTETKPVAAEPPKWAPTETFDGHNLVANPHFSLKDDQRGKPSHWYSLKDLAELNTVPYPETLLERLEEELADKLRKARNFPNFLTFYELHLGHGTYEYDAREGRTHPGSMRVVGTGPGFGVTCNLPMIDYGKRQTFSFYAKTDRTTGRVFPEILWFAMNMDADPKYYDKNGLLMTPRLQLIGRSAGEAITGTRDWTRLSVEARPPFGTIYAAVVARVETNTAGTVWIDDAELNGYGSEPLEISYSFLGYHPQSHKQLTIKSFAKSPVRWTLADAPTGAALRKGTATYHSYEWFSKRHYYHLDLTDFRQEGEYRVTVTQADRKATADPFAIRRDVYRTLTQKLLHGLWLKRMNCDVPGGHEPDCMEDAYTPHSERPDRFCMYEKLVFPDRQDLLGGYYDAGDMIKHVEFWPAVLLATREMHHAVRPPFTDRTDDDVHDEMRWAFRAFHKFQKSDGTFILSSKPQGYGTDNVPAYSVERTPDQGSRLQQAAGVAAMAAYVLRQSDPKLSERYLEVARRDYECNGLWQIVGSAKTVGPVELSAAAKCLFAETYLSALTRERAYADRMGRHARVVAAGLSARAYGPLVQMYHSAWKGGGAPQDCAWVPVHFLRLHPKHPAATEIKEGLRAFASHVRELSDGAAWGQARAMNSPADGVLARFPSSGRHQRSIGYWPMLAYTLSEIGMLLGDRDIVHLAERQLQWCLGKNFADLSMVQGVGKRFVAGGDHLFWQTEFFDAWLRSDRKLMYFDGNVPTGAMRDLGDGTIRVTKGDNWAPPLCGYPKGYCAMAVTPDYGIHPAPSENYLPQTAQFALAATGVYKAMRWLEGK